MKRVVIRAPSNLGLRPLRPGHVPGTWRAPQALTEAGLIDVLRPLRVVDLPRPEYRTEVQGATRLLNGPAIRAFNLDLAKAVADCGAAGEFAFVVGGDCSTLLGALAGLRRLHPISLVHIDGHSDFRHPGNYDPARTLGTVAGMDLALATGHGEPLLTTWPLVAAPLVPEEQVVQIGERESRDPDWAWPDVTQTAITRIDVFLARELGLNGILARTRETLERTGWRFWIHVDIDVLDQGIMPAVDSPGSPGIDPHMLCELLRRLTLDPRCAGMTLAIFDPDLDSDGEFARLIVRLIDKAFES